MSFTMFSRLFYSGTPLIKYDHQTRHEQFGRINEESVLTGYRCQTSRLVYIGSRLNRYITLALLNKCSLISVPNADIIWNKLKPESVYEMLTMERWTKLVRVAVFIKDYKGWDFRMWPLAALTGWRRYRFFFFYKKMTWPFRRDKKK